MGFFDNGNYFLSHPGELASRIFGSGDSQPEQQQADPLAGFTPQAAPAEDPKYKADLKQSLIVHYGMPDYAAETMVNLEPKTREAALKQLVLSKAPKAPKAEKAPKEKINREILKKQFPQAASVIDAAPEGSLGNITTMLYKQQLDAGKGEKKPAGFHIDRSHLPPGLQKFGNYMTDETISGIAKKQFEDQQAGGGQDQGGYWPRLKGHSLKIMQDEAFKRSGLKTGDTVCIKIP